MTDIHELLRAADGGPAGSPDLDAIRRRGRWLVVRRGVGVAAGVVMVLGAAAGALAQLAGEGDRAPVIEQPSPDPDGGTEDVGACQPPQRRPAYLPWLQTGEAPPPAVEVRGGTLDSPDATLVWVADPADYTPGTPGHDQVTVTRLHDYEQPQDESLAVEVNGHPAQLMWVGDPGVGAVTVTWREASGPCGAYSVSLLVSGSPDYLDIPGGDDFAQAGDDEIDELLTQIERTLEQELLRIAQSLEPPAPEQPTGDDRTADCAAGPDVPEFAGVPDGWTALPGMPQGRARPAVVWTGSQILAIGGDTNFGGRNHAQVYSFDPRNSQWSCAAPAPFETGIGDAVWTGERVLLYGNRTAASYDPATDIWTPLPDPPDGAPRDPVANIWTGREWIVWGSTSRTQPSTAGAIYRPDTDQWQLTPDAPVAINQGNGIWTDNELLVVGARLNRNNAAPTPNAEGVAYNPRTDSWRRLPATDLSPQAAGIAATGAGMALAYDYETTARLYDPDTDQWDELPNVPVEFMECYPTAVTLDSGRVFLWYCGQAALFDPQTRTFERIETPVSTHWDRPANDNEVDMIAGTITTTTGTEVYFVGTAHEGHATETWRWAPR